MEPLIRQAELKDLGRILTLYRELRPNDPILSEDVARSHLSIILAREDINIVVCEAEQTLVATCMLALIPNLASGGRPFGVIEHVVTSSAHQKRGYARRILEHALELAWSRNCCKVMLLSGAKRTEAHKLYEAVGFKGSIERGFVIKP